MRIGIIGLGNIAQKAYLPVITSRRDVELILCTRNGDTLNKLSEMYRIRECVHTVDELINHGIDAAFVHSSTESHKGIVEKLLNNNINVYVDKPISYSYDEALKLVKLSEDKGLILMVGFNRRFAPMYKKLKDLKKPDIVIMQKNRLYHPENIRRFIFDDFIHVVDTLRFLSPSDIDGMQVKSLIMNNSLYNVVLQLSSRECTLIGIMNRDSGTTEETVEYMNPNNKWIIRNLSDAIHFNNGTEKIIKFNDWDPVLYRRGFYQIIDHFISSVKNNETPSPSARDSLLTHEICEKVVLKLQTAQNIIEL